MNQGTRPPRAERKPVVIAAQCRTQSGLRDQAEISNISAEGCCITARSLYFRIGSRVTIRPEGMEGLTGIIRWVAGDRAGMEFDQPLYGPVLDHLADRYGTGELVGISRHR